MRSQYRARERLLSNCCVFSFEKVGEITSLRPWKSWQRWSYHDWKSLVEWRQNWKSLKECGFVHLSQYMVTDNEKWWLENPYIFDHWQEKISNILPLLESILQSNRPLLIIADDVDGSSSNHFVLNKIRGTLNRCQAPGFGDRPQKPC